MKKDAFTADECAVSETRLYDPRFLNAVYGPIWRRFVYRDGNRCFAHVAVAQRIEGTACFFSEPWLGYFDPFTNSIEAGFLQEALASYSEWARSHHIVGELIRLEPGGRLESVIRTIREVTIDTGQLVSVLELPVLSGFYFDHLKPPCRRQIIKAQRFLRPIFFDHPSEDEVSQLFRVHSESLRRCGAAPKWYMEKRAYDELAEVPEFYFIGIGSRMNGALVAMAGVLLSNRTAHVLLIGLEDNARYPGACDLLYYSIVERVLRRVVSSEEIRTISFGGGRGVEAMDGLIRFKAKFSLGNLRRCQYLIMKHDRVALAKLERECSAKPVPGLDASSQLKARHFPYLNQVYLR